MQMFAIGSRNSADGGAGRANQEQDGANG
jgi:hypothetical protein